MGHASLNRHPTPMRTRHVEAGGGGAHWVISRPGWSADQAQLPTAFSFHLGVDTWGP